MNWILIYLKSIEDYGLLFDHLLDNVEIKFNP